MDWKLWYDDGTTFSSDDGEPFEAPCHGVICVASKDEGVGRKVCSKWDWYILRSDSDGDWWGVDTPGLMDQVLHFTDKLLAVKQGRCATNKVYNDVMVKAIHDPDLPQKSSYRSGETAGQVWGAGETN